MNRSIKDTAEHKEFWRIIDADRDEVCIAKEMIRLKRWGD